MENAPAGDAASDESRVAPVWRVEELHGIPYVVRSGVWEAKVRISPVLRGDPRIRAQEVCAALNRLAG